MRTFRNFERHTALLFFCAMILGVGILAWPFTGLAQNVWIGISASAKPSIHGNYAFRAAYQDAAQAPPPATPPAAAPAQPRKVELPEGDGKPIATEYCQDCHPLTNLTRSHRTSDVWSATVHWMLGQGARLPPENVDTLVQYLAANFGPETDAQVPDAQAPPVLAAAPRAAGPSAPAQPMKVELPEGEGKAIAEENCQLCHQLTNLVTVRKSLEGWRNAVELMIGNGAPIQADQVDTLIRYLARNFGPKSAGPVAGAVASGAPAKSPAQTQ